MKLFVFWYQTHNWSEILAVIAYSEEEAEMLVDAKARGLIRGNTRWPDNNFVRRVYEINEVAQLIS
jgi:hypothetical protein